MSNWNARSPSVTEILPTKQPAAEHGNSFSSKCFARNLSAVTSSRTSKRLVVFPVEPSASMVPTAGQHKTSTKNMICNRFDIVGACVFKNMLHTSLQFFLAAQGWIGVRVAESNPALTPSGFEHVTGFTC